MERRDTRSAIIAVGTELIARQGYNATGLDAILKQAGVPKGSFYHYFASKEEFGLAVIDRFAAAALERIDACLNDRSLSPLARIRTYLENSALRLEQDHCSKGCLAGNLGQELADQNEVFRQRLEEIFQAWQQAFAVCLAEAQTAGDLAADLDPAETAVFILAGHEGSLLRAKVMKSSQPLRAFIALLFRTILR